MRKKINAIDFGDAAFLHWLSPERFAPPPHAVQLTPAVWHHPIHAGAYVTAGLRLLGRVPPWSWPDVRETARLAPAAMHPTAWGEAHRDAGLIALAIMLGEDDWARRTYRAQRSKSATEGVWVGLTDDDTLAATAHYGWCARHLGEPVSDTAWQFAAATQRRSGVWGAGPIGLTCALTLDGLSLLRTAARSSAPGARAAYDAARSRLRHWPRAADRHTLVLRMAAEREAADEDSPLDLVPWI